MRESNDKSWFSEWEEELPSPDELMPLSKTLITPDLARVFDISPLQREVSDHLQEPVQSPFPVSAAEFADSGEENARALKRPRLVWTPQLHKRFVDAVAQLGIKNAVPKTIMQLMNVDGLTRENVASHLQKYRLYLKRMQIQLQRTCSQAPPCPLIFCSQIPIISCHSCESRPTTISSRWQLLATCQWGISGQCQMGSSSIPYCPVRYSGNCTRWSRTCRFVVWKAWRCHRVMPPMEEGRFSLCSQMKMIETLGLLLVPM